MARATYIPVTPRVLEWAMAQAGVSDEDLAVRCETSPDVVEDWRRGEAQPTKTQFNRLVTRLRRPSAVYFLADPPEDDSAVRAFRAPTGGASNRELTDKELVAIQSAERIQAIARWVRRDRGDDPVRLPRIDSSIKLGAQTRSARTFLSWSTAVQTGSASVAEMARLMRARLENEGILVLQFSMASTGCRGFSLHDDTAPVIAVNSAYTTEARVFTFMHEYAHLARGAGHICQHEPDSAIERSCESFAGAFLMPRSDLERHVRVTLGDRPVASTGEVARIARHFKTSLRATALRLQRIDRAVAGLYDTVDREADFKGEGFSRDNTGAAIRLREWGDSYAGLLFDAERRGLLGRTDLLEYFNLPDSQVRDIRERLHARDNREA